MGLLSQAWRLRLLTLGSYVLAAAIWLPAMHLLFEPNAAPTSSTSGAPALDHQAEALLRRHLALWSSGDKGELARMRQVNAEWDFMGRTFLVLALANVALRDPGREETMLAVIDRVIDDTERTERERGVYHFLMGYARARPFVAQPARSVFVDGEIALMLAARRLVRDSAAHRARFIRRRAQVTSRIGAGPITCAESYPDECWTFCNAAALAAVRLGDALDGSDHSTLIATWLASAKTRLVHQPSGLLASSYTYSGGVIKDGPEGSSIWFVAHCLQLLDPPFATGQYRRARRLLGRSLLGFGYAREWPPGHAGRIDVDSGLVVPVLEASPGASGLALVGAAAFGDHAFLRSLRRSLGLAGFGDRDHKGGLRYLAGNQVGDAVVLYALTLGPLWRRAAQRLAARQLATWDTKQEPTG